MIFKYRVPPLALTVVFACLMYIASVYSVALEFSHHIRMVVLFSMLGVAMVFVAMGVGKFRFHKTTVNPVKPESASVLVTTGIYSISRNPMYAGFLLALVGWGVYLCNVISFILVGIFFLYMHHVQIKSEEKALAVVFGESYNVYKLSVRRWL